MLKLIPVLAALAAATPALAADPAPVIAADRAFAALSAARGPRAAFAEYLAPTATMVLLGAVDTAPREKLVADFPVDPAAFRLNWTPVGGAMSEDATLGVTWGTFTREVGGRPAGEGAYTSVWRKQADGRWRVIEDTASEKLPPMPPPPMPPAR